MNIQQITTYIWVVKLGGFRRAAEKLNTSQAAISARIASLEEKLGHALLERGGGAVTPTREGLEFLSYAEKVLFLTDDMQSRIARTDNTSGMLRLGVSETIVHSWLPAFLLQFSEAYPQVDLDLSVDVTVNLRDALLSRALDLAFLMGPVSEFTVGNIELPSFPLAWLAGPRTMKAISETSIEVVLRDTPVVTFARNTRPFGEVRTLIMQRFGFSVRMFPTTSLAAGYQMVQHDIAIGALPRTLGDPDHGRYDIQEVPCGLPLNDLRFTASFVTDPPNQLAAHAAEIAREIAISRN